MPDVKTSRRPDGVIVTTCSGRILADEVRQWGVDFNRLSMRRDVKIWVFFAEEATGYEPAAVDVCVAHFKEAMKYQGLETILVVLTSRLVRMGARLVGMLSHIDMHIYESRLELERELEKILLEKKLAAIEGPPSRASRKSRP